MNLGSEQFYGYLWQLLWGAGVTLELFLTSFATALVLGVAIAIATLSPNPVVQGVWRVYASIVMGVPTLLVIFLLFYGGAPTLAKLPGGDLVEVTPFGAGVAALGVVYAAYVAELVRGAVGNLPRGQFDAARALGLSRAATWWKVVLPQAFRLALPGLASVWSFMLKETPLVSLAGLHDLVAASKIAAGATKEPFVFFISAALFFILFSALTLRLTGMLERRLDLGQHGARG